VTALESPELEKLGYGYSSFGSRLWNKPEQGLKLFVD